MRKDIHANTAVFVNVGMARFYAITVDIANRRITTRQGEVGSINPAHRVLRFDDRTGLRAYADRAILGKINTGYAQVA